MWSKLRKQSKRRNNVIQRDNIRLYQIHRKNMQKITHKIDNDAPLLPIENVTLTGKAKHDANRFKDITRWNRVLINHIVKMYRTKGMIDSYNEFAGLRVTKLKQRHTILERYDTENLKILMRLLKTNPIYNTNKYLCDWECKKLKDIWNSCKRPVMLRDLFPKVRRYYEISLNSEKFNTVYVKFKLGQNCIGRVIFRICRDLAPVCSQMFLNFLTKVKCDVQNESNRDCIDIQWIYPGMYLRFLHTEARKPFDYVYTERHHHMKSRSGTLAVTVAPDNSLHFVVTFQSIPSLYENYTIFGYVLHGFDVLKHIEYFGHPHTGRSTQTLCIYETGSILE